MYRVEIADRRENVDKVFESVNYMDHCNAETAYNHMAIEVFGGFGWDADNLMVMLYEVLPDGTLASEQGMVAEDYRFYTEE